MLIMQVAWVLQTVQGFQLPLIKNAVQYHLLQEMSFSLAEDVGMGGGRKFSSERGNEPSRNVTGEFVSQIL